MVAALLLALVVQAPKSSMLGNPPKPWWETIRPGDVRPLRSLPGYAVPLVNLYEFGGEKGLTRTTIHREIFFDDVRSRDWKNLHKMVDRGHLRYAYGHPWVRVLAVGKDRDTGIAFAEVVYGDSEATLKEMPAPPASALIAYAVPIACIDGSPTIPHPDLGRFPMLIRRSRDLATVECSESDCDHMEAIPYADAERSNQEKHARQERLRRKVKDVRSASPTR